MKGIKVIFMTASIFGAVVSPLAVATGPDWSTGQGLVDTCKVISTPEKQASDEDVAALLFCVAQFKTWRDSWVFADAFNERKYNKRGPICISNLISNKTLIEGFLQWAKYGMTAELKRQPSTASVFTYMSALYPCK